MENTNILDIVTGLKNYLIVPCWRIQSHSKNYPTISYIAYIDAREVMDILDETVGPHNWQSDFKELKGNLYAGIAIKINDEWVWKWDCGTKSKTEPEKGESSDAFKRAAVKWGVGRFLYELPVQYVTSNEKKTPDNYPFPVDSNNKKIKDISKFLNEKLGFISKSSDKKETKKAEDQGSTQITTLITTQEATQQPEKKPGKPTAEKSPAPSGSAGEQKAAGAEKIYTENEIKEAIKAVDTCVLDTEELRKILNQYPGLAGQSQEFKKTRDTKISIILNSQLEDFENKALEIKSTTALADLITQYPSLNKNDEYRPLFEELAERHLNRIRELNKISDMKEKDRAKEAREALKKEAIAEFKYANGSKELAALGEKYAQLIESSVKVKGEYEHQKEVWRILESGTKEEREKLRADNEARKNELLNKEEIQF